jgi:hypothetical protein
MSRHYTTPPRPTRRGLLTVSAKCLPSPPRSLRFPAALATVLPTVC